MGGPNPDYDNTSAAAAAPMGGGGPEPAPPQPAAQPAPAGPPPAVVAQNIHEAGKTSGIKSFFNHLMGQDVDYQIDPATGKETAVPVQRTPGQLFRSILGGALLGMAGGAGQSTFAGGVGMGAANEQQHLEQADKQKYERARENYENQMKAKKDQREASAFDTEQQLRKAQIAEANTRTAGLVLESQGKSFITHKAIADQGAAHAEMYEAAGIRPVTVAEGVPESQMTDYIKNRPGASTLDWVIAGVKTTLDDKGTPQYEYTLKAYDPTSSVKLTDKVLTQWKANDLFKYYPEAEGILKAGKELSPTEFIQLKREAEDSYLKKMSEQKTTSDLAKDKADINYKNAEAARAYTESKKLKLESHQSELFSSALNDLDKAQGDFTKLSPKAKLVIAESSNKLIGDYNTAIRDALANGQNVDELMSGRDNLLRLSQQAFGSMAGQNSTADKVTTLFANPRFKNLSADEQRDTINSSTTMSPEEKQRALKMIGGSKPPDNITPDTNPATNSFLRGPA